MTTKFEPIIDQESLIVDGKTVIVVKCKKQLVLPWWHIFKVSIKL